MGHLLGAAVAVGCLGAGVYLLRSASDERRRNTEAFGRTALSAVLNFNYRVTGMVFTVLGLLLFVIAIGR